MKIASRSIGLLVLSLVVGCGSDSKDKGDGDIDSGTPDTGTPVSDGGADTGDGGEPVQKPLLSLKEGNSWTYRVVQNGMETTKVQTIGALEKVGGTGPNADKLAFKVVTKKGDSDETISWQAVEGDRVVRYREQAFSAATGELALEEHWMPAKLRIDQSPERLIAGASWLEDYQEVKLVPGAEPVTSTRRDRWLVDSPSEEVTVPAGTFKAIVLVKAGSGDAKTYWYVPGIGKVKETGGQTEELVSYEVSP